MPQEERTVLIGLTAELATAPVLPGGAVLRQVTADDDMRRIAALQSAVWGQDWNWLGENLIARIAAAPQGIAVLAAEADGDVVSAGWLAFFQPGADSFARLLGGSTLPQWRGRGIYRALVAARAQRAAARSVTYLQVDASQRQCPHLAPSGIPCGDHHHRLRVDAAAARQTRMTQAAGLAAIAEAADARKCAAFCYSPRP